jgi:hypothetical protein
MLYHPKLGLKNPLARPRIWLARALSRAATTIAPELSREPRFPLQLEELLKLPNVRINPSALSEGKVEVRYRALDPMWRDDAEEPEGMIRLRDHMMRLCSVADELSNRSASEGWHAVAENLHLAASLRDLAADTDVYGDSFMCSTAADYDEAHSEVAAKYLAGVTVFNLAWVAYESAVEMASGAVGVKHAKGARGRDLVFHIVGNGHFPYLREAVFAALDMSPRKRAALYTRDMRRMLAAGSLAGIAAEHLREFRNALVHGTLPKPMPEDWGKDSRYVPDDDPGIRQFHGNTRLTLLLIQILTRSASDESEQLRVWFSDPQPARLVLTQLHCPPPSDEVDPLPLNDAPVVEWEHH